MPLHFVSMWLKGHNCLYTQHPENVNRCEALKLSPDRSLIRSWQRLMRATADMETRSGWLIIIILSHSLVVTLGAAVNRGNQQHLLVRKALGLIYNLDASLTSSWKETSLANTTAAFKQAIHHHPRRWAIYAVGASSKQEWWISSPRLHPMSCTRDKHVFYLLFWCYFLFPYCFLFSNIPSVLSVAFGMSANTIRCSFHHCQGSNVNDITKTYLYVGTAIWDPLHSGRGVFTCHTQSQHEETI